MFPKASKGLMEPALIIVDITATHTFVAFRVGDLVMQVLSRSAIISERHYIVQP